MFKLARYSVAFAVYLKIKDANILRLEPSTTKLASQITSIA